MSRDNLAQVWSYLGLPTSFHRMVRDDGDADLLNQLVGKRMREWHQSSGEKELYLRTRIDGDQRICRALLSAKYGSIPHSWTVKALRSMLGGRGKIASFNGSQYESHHGDYLRFNVVLPESIGVIGTDESDTDYAALICCDNHESGGGSYHVNAGLARAICGNGLILGHKVVNSIRKKHLGNIDFHSLAVDIRELLVASLEYKETAREAMERLLSIDYAIRGDVSPEAVIAQTAKRMKLTKAESKGVYGALYAEPTVDWSAGNVVNAFTRYAGSSLVKNPQRRWEIESGIGETAEQWFESDKAWEKELSQAESFNLDNELNRVLNAQLVV